MHLSENLRGILLMCTSMAAFTINDTFMKSVTQSLPLYQTIAMRGVIALVGLGLLAALTGAFRFRPSGRDGLLILLRSLADVAATILFLEALLRMPLANLSAILQALPLLITLAAALVFGDKIGWRRMTAILVGLVGVLLIIRPGTEGFDRWSLLGIASVLCVVVRDLAVRPIQGAVPSGLVALGAAVAVTAMGWIGAGIQGWKPVSPAEAAEVLAAGLFVIVGYLSSVSAMRHGDIGLVAPFRYTSLIWAIVLGLLVFGDLPDVWTLVGAAIVVGAGLFTLWREQRLRRPSRPVPASPDPVTPDPAR
ncbi:DMT family transporter [Albidovulum sp.]|uniref:DMT family transporter n=1 Tax=Albidovulum sp. TaxID=1872424 RepID=UPI0039B82C3B